MDLVDLGGSKLDERTNALLVQCKAAPVGDDENEAPGFENTPVFGSVGVTCRHWPKDERGHAQAVLFEELPGSNGVVGGMRDPRVADVVAELGEGESCLHSTGPKFDARVFCKDQLVSIIVGDDTTITVDRKNKKIVISGWGRSIQLSEADGISMACDGSLFQMKDGVTCITGKVVLGGRTPFAPVQSGPAPVSGTNTPATSTPAAGVFIGV